MNLSHEEAERIARNTEEAGLTFTAQFIRAQAARIKRLEAALKEEIEGHEAGDGDGYCSQYNRTRAEELRNLLKP